MKRAATGARAHTHTLTASWKHKYWPQLWYMALFFAYPTETERRVCVSVWLWVRFHAFGHVLTSIEFKKLPRVNEKEKISVKKC